MKRCDWCDHYREDPYRAHLCVRGNFSRPTAFERHPEGNCKPEAKHFKQKEKDEARTAS